MHRDAVIKPGDKQRTLRESIDYVGIGLHTGRRVSLRVYPGQPDTGIWFVRKDVGKGQGVIPALWHRVVDTRMCTVLGNEPGSRSSPSNTCSQRCVAAGPTTRWSRWMVRRSPSWTAVPSPGWN